MGLSFRRRVRQRLFSLVTATPVRVLAWLTLIAATGLLVRAEVKRPELPEGVEAFTDLAYHKSGRRPRLDVYVPRRSAPPGGRPALVAIHGGGWRGGDKSEYGRSLLELVQAGVVVISVDYQLSGPGRPSWPDNLDDIREAVRWVHRHTEDYGIDPARVAVIGASAGAHLALVLGLEADSSTRVAAIIDFYGPTDLPALRARRTDADEPIAVMLGGGTAEVPDRYAAASPLGMVRSSSPPVLIFHGDLDTRVPLDQSLALDSALTANGVPHRLVVIPGARHGFGLHVGPRRLTPEILEFLETAWRNSSTRMSFRTKARGDVSAGRRSLR
jgi:acetyl esterase/lipase